MCDVNDRDIGIDLQDHTLQRADQMVVGAVVRRQRNNRVSQWSLSAWAFCEVARLAGAKSHIFTLKDGFGRVKNPTRKCCAIANACAPSIAAAPFHGLAAAVFQCFSARQFAGTMAPERASYNGSIEASQASDVGSIPIARSKNAQNFR